MVKYFSMKTPLTLKKYLPWITRSVVTFFISMAVTLLTGVVVEYPKGENSWVVDILSAVTIFSALSFVVTIFVLYITMRLRYRRIKQYLKDSGTEMAVVVTAVRSLISIGTTSGEVFDLATMFFSDIYEVEAEMPDKSRSFHFAIVISNCPKVGAQMTILTDMNDPQIICLK